MRIILTLFSLFSVVFVVTTVLRDRRDYFEWSNKS